MNGDKLECVFFVVAETFIRSLLCWCVGDSVSFQSFVLRHLVTAPVRSQHQEAGADYRKKLSLELVILPSVKIS